MQEQYASEFRRQAETFGALARLSARHADTEEMRSMVAVARGLAKVCRMLAEACDTNLEEAVTVE